MQRLCATARTPTLPLTTNPCSTASGRHVIPDLGAAGYGAAGVARGMPFWTT